LAWFSSLNAGARRGNVSGTLDDLGVRKVGTQPAHVAELVVAAREARLDIGSAGGLKGGPERTVEQGGGLVEAGMGSADGLADDLVDDPSVQQVARRQLQRGGGFDLLP
jgi:hypothetical protein